MNPNRKRVLLQVIIATAIFSNALGQPYPDSLLRYMKTASENNPEVISKLTLYKAAFQKIPQAGSLTDPQISFGAFLKPMEILSGNQVADISLMQMFPWFGVLKNAKQEMTLMANARYEEFRDAELRVCFEVQKSWYDIFKIRKELAISEKNLEILKSIERLSVVKFGAPRTGQTSPASTASLSGASAMPDTPGNSSSMSMSGNKQNNITVAPTGSQAPMQNGSMGISPAGSGLADLYRIEIELGELGNKIALLKNIEKTKIALFNSYLNRSHRVAVFTGEELMRDSLEIPVEAVIDSIRTRNPMLTMAEYERQSFSARKKMVTAMSHPMVGFGLNYSVISKNEMSSSAMNGSDMIMPMVTISLPVYRKKYKAMQQEAGLLTESAALVAEAAVNSLENEYFQAVQSYEDARRRTELYEKQYKRASELLSIMVKNFTASTADLTEVLRIQQQSLDYELKQTEALTEMNIAVAWFRRLMAFKPVE